MAVRLNSMWRLWADFRRIKDANKKLNPEKCRLFQWQITFLGHVISANGIVSKPDKVQSILLWPRPKNVTEIRSLVGLCSYCCAHVPRFAEVAQPLHKLAKHAVFQRKESQEQAFRQFKEALFSAPLFLCAQYYNRSGTGRSKLLDMPVAVWTELSVIIARHGKNIRHCIWIAQISAVFASSTICITPWSRRFDVPTAHTGICREAVSMARPARGVRSYNQASCWYCASECRCFVETSLCVSQRRWMCAV